jgi:hypothetical protein
MRKAASKCELLSSYAVKPLSRKAFDTVSGHILEIHDHLLPTSEQLILPIVHFISIKLIFVAWRIIVVF